MAAANLWFKKLRSGITILGIAIGTGSIFLLMSFGLGLQALVAAQVSRGEAIDTIDVTTGGSRLLKLDDSAVKQFGAITHVTQAAGYYATAGKLTIGNANADVVTYGVNSPYLQTANLSLAAGSPLDTTKSDQAVISRAILDAVGITNPRQAIGTAISLKAKTGDGATIDRKVTIVGVTSSGSGTEAFVSDAVFRAAGTTQFAGVKVLVGSRSDVTQARRAIEGLGFTTTSPVDTLDQVDQVFRVLRIVLVSFGAVGMSIAILGMINTLTISLLERTREVALMLALGARPRDMRQLFILEAILLSLTGGLVGIIGAEGIGALVDFVLNRLASSRGAAAGFTVFARPLWLTLATLGSMALVGFLVAYVPARRAARINSVEALRRE